MKIQTRLSLLCSIVFGIIFILIAFIIYFIHYNNNKELIYKNLHNVAQISALFYLEEDELNTEEFEKVKKQFEETVSGIDYQIYDQNNRIAYGRQYGNITPASLNKIREQKQSAFRLDNYLCFGIFYEDNQGDFVIVAKDDADVLEKQMSTLFWTLLFCFLSGLVAIILLSRWVARIAYRPFSDVIRQVKNISTSDLNVRIASPGTRDELEDLTNTFNKLLSAIEDTIVIQRNFVSYVSHEFKTPLASLLGNLEVFSIKDRSPEEYRQLSKKLIRQVNQMEKILDTLIVVSDLKKEVKTGEQTRVDELVWEIIDKVTELYPHSDVRVKLNIPPEDEYLLSVSTERTQLLLMLFNLVENAVKYSQGKPVVIDIFNSKRQLCLSIADQGIGIMPEHLAGISKPFYRADHTNRIEGSGIGLSIALRIMEKNGIAYEIKSEVNTGTTIFVILPSNQF
jgi:signal transduction histidine kinase